MFFTLPNTPGLPIQHKKLYLKLRSPYKIITFKFGETEHYLDDYLKQNYGLGLRASCFQLLKQLSLLQNDDKDLIIVWHDRRLDNLASIITYGTRGHCGSKILQYALSL